jgi:pyruvate formate lyase activating enzyme
VWVELTTLLIPGHNDSAQEINAMSEWIVKELGADVPLHFSAFHPDYKMTGVPATPPETLVQARQVAMAAGLHYVYTGNVHNREGDTTSCPSCDSALIVRDWYEIKQYRLTPDGHCPDCNTKIAGCFEKFTGAFGARRIPIFMRETT